MSLTALSLLLQFGSSSPITSPIQGDTTARPVLASPLLGDSLFTPPSSPLSQPRKPKILKFSCVAVPSFPSGLSRRDYKPIRSSDAVSKKQPLNTGTHTHASLAGALQASLTHNASGSIFPIAGSSRDSKSRPTQAAKTASKRRSSQPDGRKKTAEATRSTSVKRKRSQPDAKAKEVRRGSPPQGSVSFQPDDGDGDTR